MVSEPNPSRAPAPLRTAYLVRPLPPAGALSSSVKGDDPATALGQALSALRIGCVLSSPSRLARETAERIAQCTGLHVIVDNRLAERRMLAAERSAGTTTADLVGTSDVGGALNNALSYTALRVVLVIDEHARARFLADFISANSGQRGPRPVDDACVPLEFVDDHWRIAPVGHLRSHPTALAEGRVR